MGKIGRKMANVSSTACEDLIKFNVMDEEVLVKPDLISTKMATQTESPNTTFSEASTMTDGGNDDDGFWIEED